jgi:hypothetical protein
MEEQRGSCGVNLSSVTWKFSMRRGIERSKRRRGMEGHIKGEVINRKKRKFYRWTDLISSTY